MWVRGNLATTGGGKGDVSAPPDSLTQPVCGRVVVQLQLKPDSDKRQALVLFLKEHRMSDYSVTFRISDKTVGGKSYEERRKSLIESAYSKDSGYWEETTSFILVGSALSTDAFTAKICKGLSAAEDMVLVFDPVDMSASYFGALRHVDVLRSFFPKLKKSP